jgi:hypothetical protein
VSEKARLNACSPSGICTVGGLHKRCRFGAFEKTGIYCKFKEFGDRACYNRDARRDAWEKSEAKP